MTNPTKEMRACPCKDKPANPTDCNPSICPSAFQGVRRIDYFAGIAMAGILASRPDEAIEFCDEGRDLALVSYRAAEAMESAAIAAGVGV